MYTRYVIASNATQGGVADDLMALVTGETTVANLSSSCDKTKTTIISTVAAGWSIHDSTGSSTYRRVVSAPYIGNGAKYKFFEIAVDYTNRFTGYLYESFDSGTHSGTNITANSTNYKQQLDLSGGSIIHIFSSARFIAFCSAMNNGSLGDEINSGCTIASEYKPLTVWNDDTNYPYPASIFITSQGFYQDYCFSPRIRNKLNLDVTGADAIMNIASFGASYGNLTSSAVFPAGVDAKIFTSGGGKIIPLMPIQLVRPPSLIAPIGEVSSVSDIWLAPSGTLSPFQKVSISGNEYMALPGYSTTTCLVRAA